jgi:Aspartyl protease
MPCQIAQFDPAIGPILNVVITAAGIMRTRAIAASSASNPSTLSNPLIPIPMLIDTGADGTCISPALAKQLQLVSIGLKPVTGVTGSGKHKKYLVDIGIPFPVAPPIAGSPVMAHTHVLQNAEVIEFPCSSPHYQGLIGRDLLRNAVFSMTSFARTYTLCL